MKKIACIKKDKDFERKKDLKVIEELEEDKYESLKENLKPLNKLLFELNFINDLKSSFKELNDVVEDYESERIDDRAVINILSKIVCNCISQFISLLNKWEKYLKNNFGDESEEVENFKRLKSSEYDNYFHYRLIYELRNYSFHAGYAFHQIAFAFKDGKKKIEILIDKEKLLEDFDLKGSLSDEIKLLSEDKIDIYPHVQNMYKSISKINYELVRFNIIKNANSLVKNSIYVINFLNKYKDCDGIIVIVEYLSSIEKFKSGGNISMNIEYIPMRIIFLLIKSYLNLINNEIKLFNLTGTYLGRKENSFPIKDDAGFFEGDISVQLENIKWIRIVSKLSIKKGEKTRLFCLYIRTDLEKRHAAAVIDFIKIVRESKWNYLLDYFTVP